MAKSPTPPLEIRLGYDTAASLQHLILAQMVHADEAEREGFPAMKEHTQILQPLLNRLSIYLESKR